jgi:AraC-like DNA-binding protein
MPANQVQMWIDRALEPVEYLSADYQDFAFPPHLHDEFAIGIIERGAQRFRPGRRGHLLMTAGTLCVINPGVVHEGRSAGDGGWRYRMFYPSMSLVARALDLDPHDSLSFGSHVLDDNDLFHQFRALHRGSQATVDLLERESRTLTFLRVLFGRHANAAQHDRQAPQKRTVSLVKQMLHDCCGEQLSIAKLAFEADVSETQVIRSFSAAEGLPPHAYLVALRVERAKRLIRDGLSLADVADQAGFSDQSHMSRHFKRLTSVTPGQFAKATH